MLRQNKEANTFICSSVGTHIFMLRNKKTTTALKRNGQNERVLYSLCTQIILMNHI